MKNKVNPGWIAKTLFLLMIAGSALATIGGAGLFWYFSRGLPEIITPKDYRPRVVSRVYTSDAKPELIGEFSIERRFLLQPDQIPETVIQAFISAEDDQFFSHGGVNFAAILRATLANMKAGHTVQGGSTITQQVAKSLLLTNEKSFNRKIKEAILAYRLESNLDKKQILFLYLNEIYLGHGSYGIEAAAQTYFRKSANELTVAEAALLAGLPQAPGKYSPNLNPKRAKERQLYVLKRMYENRFISQAQMTDAAATLLKIHHDVDANLQTAPYLVEQVRQYLIEKYSEKQLFEEGLQVKLPVLKKNLVAARRSIQEGLRSTDKRQGYRGPLKTLKPADVEEYLKELRLEMIERKIGYQLLLPNGTLDKSETVKHAGLKSDEQMVAVGEIYKGVIGSFDEKAKSVSVLMGAFKATLPIQGSSWAFSGASSGQAVARILPKGSVVLVRIVDASAEKVQVALEQDPDIQAALVAFDAKTGAVMALEGGYDFEKSKFNRATQAKRQPGSAFKPFIFSAALEQGFTPASIIVDSPIVFNDGEAGKWKPTNYEEKFYGDTPFRQALIRSRNIPTIKLVQAIQVPRLIQYAKSLGIMSQFPEDYSISLGSATSTLFDLVKAYSLYPRMGQKLVPILVAQVKDREGKVLEENTPVALQPLEAKLPVSPNPDGTPGFLEPVVDESHPLDPRVAYVMTHLMKEVVNYGTGHDAKQLGRVVAGKTGTTNDSVDAWFVGFTPQIVAGAWIGFDGQKSLGSHETGAKAALPVWLEFMKEAVKDFPNTDFDIPQGVVFATVDPNTGRLAPANAPYAVREAFIEGTEPTSMTSRSGQVPVKGVITKPKNEYLKEDIE